MSRAPLSPIGRVGGKFYLANKIIPYFPEHARYIEPFGGAMHLLFRKTPAPFEVYNDIDGNLVNFFRIVQSQPDKLFKRLAFTLYSRQWFDEVKTRLDIGTSVERAAHFYMVNRMSFACNMRQWGMADRGVRGYFRFEKRLMEAHQRLQGVYIEHRDFRWIIERYDAPDALFYLDPPYIFNDQRGTNNLYENEMTDADHADLVELLKSIQGKVILSGYANDLYDCFERVSLGEVATSIHGGRGVRKKPRKTEYIWKNF